MERDRRGRPDEMSPEARWGLGCLVGATALAGVLILVIAVQILLTLEWNPPTWVQVTLGVVMAVGGSLFAWLLASALARGTRGDTSAVRRLPTSRRAPELSDTDEAGGTRPPNG